MYKGNIHFKKALFEESDKENEAWAISRKYIYNLLKNKTCEESSQIANIIYDIYIKNLINIASTYSYNYLTLEQIKNDCGNYILNTQENQISSNINLFSNQKLVECEKNTVLRLMNSLEDNFSYYQAIIGILNCKINKIHSFEKPLIIDGIHRFIVNYEMVRAGKNIKPSLIVILDGNINNYCELIIPKWLYEKFVENNPLIEHPSKFLNCIQILEEFQIYENSDIWYKIKARNANLVVYLLMGIAFMIDVFYSRSKKNELYFTPNEIIHNEKILKEKICQIK